MPRRVRDRWASRRGEIEGAGTIPGPPDVRLTPEEEEVYLACQATVNVAPGGYLKNAIRRAAVSANGPCSAFHNPKLPSPFPANSLKALLGKRLQRGVAVLLAFAFLSVSRHNSENLIKKLPVAHFNPSQSSLRSARAPQFHPLTLRAEHNLTA